MKNCFGDLLFVWFVICILYPAILTELIKNYNNLSVVVIKEEEIMFPMNKELLQFKPEEEELSQSRTV